MQRRVDVGISIADFRVLSRTYRRDWPVRMAAVTPDGIRRYASGWWPHSDSPSLCELMGFVVNEALRWGEPTITYGEGGGMFWAVPLMHNAQLLGGLVATIHEDELFPGETTQPTVDLKQACTELRLLAEQHNLTNAALLETRRWQYVREQERAEMLQAYRVEGPMGVRQLYLQAEPQLMAAVRRGDRTQARAVLNQILAVLLSVGGERFGLVRSFFIELVAMMCRTAVEAGGEVEYLLGSGYHSVARLAAVEQMEQLAPCLHDVLDRTIDSMTRHRDSIQSIVIANAVTMMQQRLASDLTRDGVAEAMCLSPSHFSRLFKEHTGITFSELLTRLRVDQAAELLVRTDLSMSQIAERCGFTDSSYFGKVFRRQLGRSPTDYRADHDHGRVPNSITE